MFFFYFSSKFHQLRVCSYPQCPRKRVFSIFSISQKPEVWASPCWPREIIPKGTNESYVNSCTQTSLFTGTIFFETCCEYLSQFVIHPPRSPFLIWSRTVLFSFHNFILLHLSYCTLIVIHFFKYLKKNFFFCSEISSIASLPVSAMPSRVVCSRYSRYPESRGREKKNSMGDEKKLYANFRPQIGLFFPARLPIPPETVNIRRDSVVNYEENSEQPNERASRRWAANHPFIRVTSVRVSNARK